jgi:hypothetical protein
VALTETYGFGVGDVVGVVEVPKSKTQVPADLRTETERLDDLVHALADLFGRKAVLVWPDDTEVVVEPRPKPRLDR